MAFTVTAGTVASKTTGTTLSPALPDLTGATTGTLLVCRLWDALSTSQPATPSGWTAAVAASQSGGTDNWTVIYWRYWVSGVAAPAFTGLGNSNGTAQVIRLEGAAASSPIDSADGVGTVTNSSSLTLSSVTPSVGGCLIVVGGTEGNSGATSASLSLDVVTIISSTFMNGVGTNDARSQWGYTEQTTAAAMSATFSWSGATSHASMARIVVRPGSTTVSLDRAASESLGLSDAATRSVAFARNTAESLSLSDVAAQSPLYARGASEALSLDDGASRSAQTFVRVASDSVSLTDAAVVSSIQTSRAVTEALTLTDTATADVGGDLSRSASEALALSDVASASVALNVTASEELVLSDSASTGADSEGGAMSGNFMMMGVGGGGGGTPFDPTKLRYAPPAQTTPTIVALPTGFYSGTFGATEDVILVMPDSARTSNCQVDGGRHIRLVSGKHTHGTTGAAYYFTNITGSVFIEGLDLDMNGQNADAINVGGASGFAPDVYIQYARPVGVTGTEATEHADIFQPLGDIGTLYVDRLTGRSNYQAFFLAQESWTIESVEMHRTDLAYGAGGDAQTQLIWWGTPGTNDQYPVTLGDDVYITPRAGQTLAQSVWPDDTQGANAPIVAGDGSITWPPVMEITGSIKPGPPPGGDFAPAADVGLLYVSPGYQNDVPADVPADVFVKDTFADVGYKLTSRQGEKGALWLPHPIQTATPVISAAGRLRSSGSGIGMSYASGAPTTAEYDLEYDLYVASKVGTAGMWARLDTTAETGYLVWCNGAKWVLYQCVAAAFTPLDEFVQSLTVGGTYHVKLAVRDASKVLSIDGAVAVSSATNVVTAAGRIGTWNETAGSETTGFHIDNVVATNAA